MVIKGPKYGYARGEGIRVRALSYKNDAQTKTDLKKAVADMERELGAKVKVIGAGASVPSSFTNYIKKTYVCDNPDWTVPHMQVHIGIPASDLQASQPASEPEAKPASKPKAENSKQASAKKDMGTIMIQADLWDTLKQIGG